MKRLLVATIAASLGLSSVGGAHEHAAGRTAAEQRNLDIVMDLILNVLAPLKVERFKDYVAPIFIEHNPTVEGNIDGLVSHFKALKPQFPNGLPPMKIIKASVDGDLVTVILARSPPESKDGSAPHLNLGFEMMRVKNGKVVEHWDEVMIPPPERAK